jgi:3-deoxy-7-phosphoheptulonate synthase
MAFEYLRQIPPPDEVKQSLPLPAQLAKIKQARDSEIQAVFERRSGKFLVVIGPCSAHDEDAVCEYIEKLAKVQEQTRDKLVLVPRIYTNKPRTLGKGYKGMLHQPDPLKSPNMVEGLKAIRRMHLRAMSESHLTAADEMLYPGNHPYLDDMLSYVAVGARSVENQQHRLTASGVDIPVGMKNPTSGDLTVMLNSIEAAQGPHVFSYNGFEVRTTGNPHVHAIVRGAVDRYGKSIPNYHYEDLIALAEAYRERELANPSVIVDTNHANSDKRAEEQPRIALEVLRSRSHCASLKDMVRGLMVESFLVEGTRAEPGSDVYGQSITDPCLGWDSSERLLKEIAGRV